MVKLSIGERNWWYEISMNTWIRNEMKNKRDIEMTEIEFTEFMSWSIQEVQDKIRALLDNNLLWNSQTD